MNEVPAELLESVRDLASVLTWPSLVGGCAEVVAGFAALGVEAWQAAELAPGASADAGRRRSNAPGDVRRRLRPLAERYGWPVVVAACAELVEDFARRGAAAFVVELDMGPSQFTCPRCRTRDAQRRHMENVLARSKTTRPIGGAPADDAD